MADTSIIDALNGQARICTEFGAPFCGALIGLAAQDVAAGGPAAGLLAPWRNAERREIVADAATLRLLGAFHDLALSGLAPELTRAFPGDVAAGDAAAAWRVLRGLIPQHAARLSSFMTQEPQTNEVGRSAFLMPGLQQVARVTGLPLRCFEIAASAGLNISWDAYRYQLGGAAWGDAASSVKLAPNWRGTAPVLGPVQVVERAGCDRKPIDLGDADQRQRLRAYVWADQRDRFTRLSAAIDLAVARSVHVEAKDAGDFVRTRAAPQAGAATIVYHSVFWSYMPRAAQDSLRALLNERGTQATRDAPFAWLAAEPTNEKPDQFEIRLTTWPSGAESLLGLAHPHGAWVEWFGAGA